MKNNKKSLAASLVIVAAIIIIGVGAYYYSKSIKPQKPTSFLNTALSAKYEVLANQNLWSTKLIKSNNPEEWSVPEKNIVIKVVDWQDNFYCGGGKAVFENYSSYNTGAVGGWNSVSVVDCGSYYFVYEYGDSGPKLYGPFNLGTVPVENPVVSSTTFEIGKPFTMSGNSQPGNSLALLYTSDKILQNSLVTARVYNFFPDACARSGGTACPLKGEQMVRIDLSVTEAVGASWHDKAVYLTDKTYKIQIHEGYSIELISINSQKKEATVLIKKVI